MFDFIPAASVGRTEADALAGGTEFARSGVMVFDDCQSPISALAAFLAPGGEP
jgi:hypothetical protein